MVQSRSVQNDENVVEPEKPVPSPRKKNLMKESSSASEKHTDFIKKASICLKLMTIFVTFVVKKISISLSQSVMVRE